MRTHIGCHAVLHLGYHLISNIHVGGRCATPTPSTCSPTSPPLLPLPDLPTSPHHSHSPLSVPYHAPYGLPSPFISPTPGPRASTYLHTILSRPGVCIAGSGLLSLSLILLLILLRECPRRGSARLLVPLFYILLKISRNPLSSLTRVKRHKTYFERGAPWTLGLDVGRGGWG